MLRRPPGPPLFPYTTLFRSGSAATLCSRHARSWARSSSPAGNGRDATRTSLRTTGAGAGVADTACCGIARRSEEHTSELQSRRDLVCRLLLEKKKKSNKHTDNLLTRKTTTIYIKSNSQHRTTLQQSNNTPPNVPQHTSNYLHNNNVSVTNKGK